MKDTAQEKQPPLTTPAAQRQAQERGGHLSTQLASSPRQLAQRRLIGQTLGSAVQRVEGELDEEEGGAAQLRSEPLQRMEGGLDEEEELPAAAQLRAEPAQRQDNRTGMPDGLQAGIESLSGMDMSDVRVHRNSSQPAQLNALAYAQGNDIHLGPGQEQHLPHEAWHVVQQRQGRVQATMQMAGVGVNDDEGLEREADVMGGRAVQMRTEGWQKARLDAEPAQGARTVSQTAWQAAIEKSQRGAAQRRSVSLLFGEQASARAAEPLPINAAQREPGAMGVTQRVQITAKRKPDGKEEAIDTDKETLSSLLQLLALHGDGDNCDLAEKLHSACLERLRDQPKEAEAAFKTLLGKPGKPLLKLFSELEKSFQPQEFIEKFGAMMALRVAKGTNNDSLLSLAVKAMKLAQEEQDQRKLVVEKEIQDQTARQLNTLVLGMQTLTLQLIEDLQAREGESKGVVEAVAQLKGLLQELLESKTIDDALRIANNLVIKAKECVAWCGHEENIGQSSLHREGFVERQEFFDEVAQRRMLAENVLRAILPDAQACLFQLNRELRQQVQVKKWCETSKVVLPIPWLYLRYRGSLTDGLKNESKSAALALPSLSKGKEEKQDSTADKRSAQPTVRLLNLAQFDVDAFLEIDDKAWQFWEKNKLLLSIDAKKGIGLRALVSKLKYLNPDAKNGNSRHPKKDEVDKQKQEQQEGESMTMPNEQKQEQQEGESKTMPIAVMKQYGRLLHVALEKLLLIEERVQEALNEIDGYKKVLNPKTKKQTADFGFLLQSGSKTTKQATTGKWYPLRHLQGLHVRLDQLKELRHEEGQVLAVLPEPTRTIDATPQTPGSRRRSHSAPARLDRPKPTGAYGKQEQ
jgi:Domain of unknown function (DUF4157)